MTIGWYNKLFWRFQGPDPRDTLEIRGERSWYRQSFRMAACSACDQVAVTAAASGWHAFEAPMPRYFAQAVRNAGRDLVVDVGANTGFYTLLALTVSKRLKVVAYEPMASVRSILISNLNLNVVGKRASVRTEAVSSVNGPRILFVPDNSHGLIETSASLSGTFKSKILEQFAVVATTLDAAHLDRQRVAVIKIDAESHDLEVLRGAECLLMRDRPIVFVEVLRGADEGGLTSLLGRCGYLDCLLRPDGVAELTAVVKHESDAWNHMWLPKERATDGSLGEIVAGCGVV